MARRRARTRQIEETQMAEAVVVPAAQIRNGHATRADWDDPDDTGRVGSYSRQVYGYRRADPILAMHRASPQDVTRKHLQAVERLRDDYEIAEGVSTGRGGSGNGLGPTEAMLDARQRYREAVQAVGPRLCAILLPVVLAGWTVARWAQERGMSETRAGGYMLGALDALHDHYYPEVSA